MSGRGGGVNARLKALGFGLIGLAQGLAALAYVTSEAAAVVAMVPAVWPRVLSSGEVPAFLSAFAPSLAPAAAASAEAVASRSPPSWISTRELQNRSQANRLPRLPNSKLFLPLANPAQHNFACIL